MADHPLGTRWRQAPRNLPGPEEEAALLARGLSDVFKSVGANWILQVVTAAVGLVLMPFIVRTVGDQAMGTWELIKSITGYLSLLSLGIPMASVKFFAEAVAKKDSHQLSRSVSSAAFMFLTMGGIAILAGGALFLYYELAYDTPDELIEEGRVTYWLVVAHVAASFFIAVPYGVLAAHGEFVTRNYVVMSGLLLRFGATMSILRFAPSIQVVAIIQLAVIALELLVGMIVIRRMYPDLWIRPHAADNQIVRKLFSFSLYVLLLNVGMRLAFMTDAQVIGYFMPREYITFYGRPNDLLLYLTDFLIAIAAVVMPLATRLRTEGKESELADVLQKWSKIALSLSLVVGSFLVVLGPQFIQWWVKPNYRPPAEDVLPWLMLSSLIFLPARGVALPLLMGVGRARGATFCAIFVGVLNVAISILLVRDYGLFGVALGTAIPNLVFGFVVIRIATDEVKLPLGEFLGYAIFRPLIGALPVFGLLLVIEHFFDPVSFLALLLSGLASVALFGIIQVVFVYRNDRYLDLGAKLAALRGSKGR